MNTPSPSPTPFFNHFWPKLIFILAALGVPAAVITFFSHFLTEHLGPAVIIGLLYEVGVLILGFVGQVWQKLQSRWVDRCADWLDSIIQDCFLHYRKKYFKGLYTQHRYSDVKGLTTWGTYALELDQIFVELHINPTKPTDISPNPISQTSPSGGDSLQYYLASKSLNNQHLVIIGSPGSGKTTILKHITLSMVNHKKQRSRHHKIIHTFPILLFLRDHVQSIKDQSDFSLEHALRDDLRKWGWSKSLADWIERQLTKRRCLIMLDGLDEVADLDARKKVADWVDTQMMRFTENRFVVTSRRFGYYSNPLSSVAVLEVCLFSHEQIGSFVRLWYLATMHKQKGDSGVRKKVRAEAEAKAEDLLQRLRHTPAILELAVNPLLLTMIATVHHYSDQPLPSNRMALYAEICEVFFGKRKQAQGQTLELTPLQMQEVLEPLAHYLMDKGMEDITVENAQKVISKPLGRVKLEIQPKAFLQLVENVSGLLLEQKNGVYRFAHLTFQAYLTAVHIQKKQLGDTLIVHVKEDWWRETLRLYWAMCAMADAKPIIEAYLEDDPPLEDALTLAFDYVEEARDVHPDVKERLAAILKQGVEDTDQKRWCVVGKALLNRRQLQMVYLKEGVYRDISLVTCAEYQVFLDDQQELGGYYQPGHWNSISFPAGSGQVPILGIRRSDARAFCNWLTARNKEGWHYRLPRAEEWPLEERRKQKELYAETGYWVEGDPRFVWSQEEPSDDSRQQLSDYIVRALSYARDHTHKLDLTFVRKHAHARACVLSNNRTHAHARFRAIATAFDLARAHASDLVHALDPDHIRDFAYARNFFLDLDYALDLGPPLDLYITLFLLQERINAKLPAYEGILLIKERQ